MTRSALLAFLMKQSATYPNQLCALFGEDWDEPMQGLLDLRVVSKSAWTHRGATIETYRIVAFRRWR